MSAASAGACLGFLVWNFHPAKVFMGDTGSLFLGGLVCALAFAIDMPILLIPIGIIYIVEELSVYSSGQLLQNYTRQASFQDEPYPSPL